MEMINRSTKSHQLQGLWYTNDISGILKNRTDNLIKFASHTN